MLDYQSPHGQRVTHLRGTLLVNVHQNLKELGVYDRYTDALSSQAREKLSSAIASSWIDIEFALEHYRMIDQIAGELALTRQQLDAMATAVVTRTTDTFIGSMVRATRSAGIEAFAYVMRNNQRLWDRFYQGGGCLVVEHGPKELTLESYGNPLFELGMFRMGYGIYTRALTGFFCKTAVIKNARPSRQRPHAVATRFSWV